MPELRVETTAEGAPPAFRCSTADLVYFLSFAVAERYGSTHDLSVAARELRRQHGRDILRPLLTFAEDNVADFEDRRDMEQAWQEPAHVATAARAARDGIMASAALQKLTGEFPQLLPGLDELGRIAAWSAERGGHVRLLFRF